MSHPVPDLTCTDVELALRMLGYVEADLDVDLPEESARRTVVLLAILQAVVEAHHAARSDIADYDEIREAYLAVSDHMSEKDCLCAFRPSAA